MRRLLAILYCGIIAAVVHAQSTLIIGGNVYGGGNNGDTGGSSKVNIYGGDIHHVYGGARMADVGGSAFVNIDGANSLASYIIIDQVCGGNDISGHIGSSGALPDELTQKTACGIDSTWNTFVRTSSGTGVGATKIFIGRVFGGGNGDYNYSFTRATGIYSITDKKTGEVIATSDAEFYVPDVAKTYLEILGGTIDQLYGGGNNATITDSTVICFDNTSTVVTSIEDSVGNELLTHARLHRMGVNTATSYVSSTDFQVGRCYGGNNLAEMHIQPKWFLNDGGIRHLYSGGNRGDMTSPYGLLLEIPATSTIKVDNLYGGCRMADVKPTVNGEYKPVANLPGYNFPPELSARVLVKGGDINHVYGGNDITGRVYGGSAVGIYTSVRGDVYGGGNGSYPYTDNDKLQNTLEYGDLYYEPGANSAEALNNFRPNAEQVSIRLAGESAENPTYIGGSVYCGGNSASLKTNKSKPKVELKIGSYVVAENVFLGNNGENIIKYNAKDKDEEGHDAPGTPEGVLYTMQRTDIPELEGTKFSSLNLETPATFEAYMQGVAMPLLPNVVFDDEAKGDPETYIPYTALIGSFFCGGNVGSMSAPGTIDLNDVNSVRIYNKFVGGCNDAYVPAHAGFNAECNGGFTVESHPKINVNLNGLKLCPLKLERDLDGKPTGMAWNLDETTYSTKRYVGANIYGGCYNSGHINGDVVININESTVNKQKLFEDDYFNIFGEETDVRLPKAGVSFDEQREEIFITSLGIFGAGYGLDSEIWGSTTLNFNNGYNFLVFGGGEKGAVGKKNGEGNYVYDAKYSTYVNLKGTNAGTADGTNIPAAEYIYAGGFEGLVAGDTYMNLGNGRVNASFGGSCNADILGHAETIIGKGGYPYVVEDVYGANDLGGRIRGEADFKSKVREGARALMHNGGAPATASAYVEYLQGRVRNIFGGCYGKYDYSIREGKPAYKDTINVDVDGYVRQVLAPYIPNAFVYVHPEQNVNNSVAGIFGAGEGDTNYGDDGKTPKGSDPIGDMLQDRSYVLVDIPEGYLNLKSTDIYGAGSYNGVGMWIPKATADAPATADQASAIVDLISGDISAAHGGGYEEGLTRRTVVNVPEGSIVKADKIFGGAEGTSVHKVCDVYESHVNYNSETATAGTLYGGNDAFRQTLYAHVDVTTPVWSDKAKGYKATVYGSGYGLDTWANYTEVNLKPNANPEKDGAIVYEVYGGGEMGRVANVATAAKVADVSGSSLPDLPNGYGDAEHHATGLADAMAKVRLDGLKHNTNVLIHKGATVENYAYGGGRGYDDENFGDGDVNGTTYIALMGGTVKKDIYAAGTIGAVLDEFGGLTDYRDEPFVADATAYIAGGSTRNVYGGGWKGSVGKHKKQEGDVWVDAAISDIPDGSTVIDIPGTTHVYVGIRNDQSDANKLATVKAVLGESATLSDYGFYAGVPTVQRNVYGGGEGGAVFGTTNVEQNYGYIGYVYNESEDKYEEKLDDETWTDHVGKNRLLGSGNIFGGGYIDNSSVDSTNVKMYGGYVRNSLFGGGEIAAIGRGDVTVGGYQNSERILNQIYKYGKTQVELINGNVLRDVFAGGKGYDNLGRVGTLYTDGYVFGQTEAHVHGGIVGTAENYDEGYGNVFGGGDLGYVYGKGHRDTVHPGPSPDHFYYVDGEGHWTEDCKVVVEPWAQVKADSVTIGGDTYNEYEYVPTDKLNLLKGKNDDVDKYIWAKLDDSGIIIRNAVFGGGNVADGSEKVYANTKTVFGNVTAAVRDVYRRDLITIGTEHVGGLYGGGNLSLVDGYRELHIANYGTDYYGLQQEISMDQYNNLTDRERAYFRLRYTCKQTYPGGKDSQGITYEGHSKGEEIFDEEYNMLPEGFKTGEYWSQDGVCSIYAGRLLNTLQRADLVGVLGSRMVLQGAPDRVTDVQDKQNYTINRIGELSLKKTISPAGELDETNKEHGNYFGIYSMVNYLGNLTSDVLMSETRTTDSEDADGKSYHDWKAYNKTNKKRNTATCHNQVALASGVFLELVKEPESGSATEKNYGYITGVVELDLINAKADAIGGGYVYAKNEHGARSDSGETLTTLSPYNTSAGLRTYRMYTYNENSLEDIQTSGNFIHGKKKTIIDDCYPHNLAYDVTKSPYSKAHYWYIKGSIYIYDQIINAYTGAPTAYTKETHIPVTITAGAHGQLKLVDIKQNKYAYYNPDGVTPLSASDTIKVNNNSVSFGRNDVISYWDWSQLPATERVLFVDTTYVQIVENEVTAVALEPGEGTGWHMSNNISHNTGYVLDFKMDTPPAWNTWYSEIEGTDSASTARYDGMDASTKARYIPGPTYSTSEGGVFGQRTYTVGEIVPYDVVNSYHDPGTTGQAKVEVAYVASEAVSYEYDDTPKSVSAGTPIPYSEWDAITDAAVKNKFGTAKMCISTLRLNEQTYIVYGDLLNATDIATLKTAFPSQTAAIDAALTPAHVCSSEGLYGGTSYAAGNKYDAIKGWASLTSGDRAKNKFSFNYDGLDVLIDPKYSGDMSKYHHPYDQTQSVEYVAIYNGAEDYVSPAGELNKTIHVGDTLSRTEYETLWNEKYHYTAVVVSTTEETGDDYYIAKKDFARGNIAYAKGQVIPSGTYRALSADERTELIQVLTFTNTTENPVTYYYCRDNYDGQTSVTNRNDGGTVDTDDHGTGTNVEAGWVIDATDFGRLKNNQLNYLIKGEEPTESSTLYVSRESNIEDLSKEKIISVMYQYTYNESGDDSSESTLVNEMHIVNVHIKFESGAPIIEPLLPPATVLPGTTVGMNQPKVTPGAYELIGGGWEIYSNETDANLHRNGQEYINNNTPMYWYQDDYYVSYYAKSYMGKTYSNPVQFSVANYHDLKTVLEAKEHHYYIDHQDAHIGGKKRRPKIYINDYSATSENGLDLLKNLYDLSLITKSTPGTTFNGDTIKSGTFNGHLLLNSRVAGANDLDIIFRTNIRHSAHWTSIGDETHCFGGNIHGDGHYVSALDNSLFGKLCGHVYNLGVMGTFTGGGIADVADNSGSAENCWIKTSGTPAANTKAVIGSYNSIDQVKNCYYPGNEAFDTTAPAAAMKASKTDFYYGDVAYRLNRQYLLSRYNHNKPALEAVATDTAYIVERYGNPDFLYADGTIPEEVNTDREKKNPSTGEPEKDPITGEQLYVPLYPYDYIFFGQALNYGHVEGLTHQDVPSPIVKENDVIETGDTGNRVYRAPAYFRNDTISKVYFNPYAVFAKTNAAESEVIHQGLTAVDFTGYDDAFVGSTGAAKSYGNGTVDGKFFPPLLDVDEVSHISNYGLTKNLLVYTERAETGESASVAGKTGRAAQLSLVEPAFDTSDSYGSVAAKDEAFVNGHWVYRDADADGIAYGASNDHLLIDKNDFWAPISYTFDGSSRMWYQRTPDTFAGLNTGWESVVLPFTVLTVSTHQKGELTHFYGNDNDGKIGHEYWLRKYTAIATGDEANTMKATFTRPAKGEGEGAYDMVYENTFLWDALHSAISDGQNTYYSVSHTYDDYPLQQQATPYIIGFPGKAFYEFDLSGEWTAPRCPLGFERQTVTFASHTGVTIRKSDVDMNDEEIIKTYGNYTFTPSYLNEEIAAGTQNYVMAADGSKYVKVPAEGDATPILPFRAYFAKTGNSGDAISILFTDAEDMPDVTPDNPEPEITPQGEVKRGITFTPGVGTITTKSTLDEPRVILVYGVSGALVKAFDIKPNATVTIYVPSGLVYAIRTVSGDYSSKLLVR
ncbi:MAG: hypothetical protein IKQ32_06780 [Prevotella sp.]|nr:hypothetical protein [Prevotella sp.]